MHVQICYEVGMTTSVMEYKCMDEVGKILRLCVWARVRDVLAPLTAVTWTVGPHGLLVPDRPRSPQTTLTTVFEPYQLLSL